MQFARKLQPDDHVYQQEKFVSLSYNRICCWQVQHFYCMKHFIVVDFHNAECCMHVIQNMLCYTEKSPTLYIVACHLSKAEKDLECQQLQTARTVCFGNHPLSFHNSRDTLIRTLQLGQRLGWAATIYSKSVFFFSECSAVAISQT